MSKISHEESLNLQRLLKDSEAVDNTEYIRKVKHSGKIANDVILIDKLKKSHSQLYAENLDGFRELAKEIAPFLFTNYTDIFNRMVSNELDLGIMSRLLYVISMIEESQVTQHEGSVLVGKLLKELYVDSALKRSENLDKKYGTNEEPVEKKPAAQNISWADWKNSKK